LRLKELIVLQLDLFMCLVAGGNVIFSQCLYAYVTVLSWRNWLQIY